jgi:uncharacterized protein (DUF1501 family)
MLDLLHTAAQRRKCDGTSRREFLRIGTLGLGAWTLADLLRARAAATAPGQARRTRSMIYLFLDGGASQLETFDPKMDVSAEYRSIFGAIPTRLPGVAFGSQFPLMASVADRMSIVRTLTHEDGDHGGATHWVKTGYPWPPQFLGKAPIIPQQSPSIGSIVARHFGPTHPTSGVPTYVRVTSNHGGYPGDDAAWLGSAYAPLRCGVNRGGDMLRNMELRLDRDRLGDRDSLLKSLDRLDRQVDQSGQLDGLDEFHQQALQVVLGQARSAFDLSQEDEKTRALYGPGLGQELLLARRLCEAGAGFVTLNNGYWDHHGGIIPGLKNLCPPLDRVVHAFIQDVEARGLGDDILLIVAGEFGRTPRINGGPGRDHWAAVNDAVFIGGGLRMGQVVGETDAKAATIKSRPVTVQDFMATIFRVLGIEQTLQYIDPSGRPRSMIESGQPIAELG